MLLHGFTASEFELLKYWSGWAHTLKPRTATTTTTTAAASDSESGDVNNEKNSVEHHEVDHQAVDSHNSNSHIADDEHNLDNNDDDFLDTINPSSSSAPPLPSTSVPRPDGITPAEMAHVGWMIKRIFDHGRVQYLKAYMGFSGAKQVVYCDPSLSPENCLLVATRQG